MKILVTGGLGYIGSHTVVELVARGHAVFIVDNLYNSKLDTLSRLETILGETPDYMIEDVTNQKVMEELFINMKFDGLIHFAGYKAVGESVEDPLLYYKNNLLSTIVMAELAIKYKVKKFIFSSSATVYGDQPSPLFEELDLGVRTNPYGETKAIGEKILMDSLGKSAQTDVILLRYFNPVGAHSSGLIGEDPEGIPNNLMPYITRVARGALDVLTVFGDDYDTPDGTGIRDYIHVVDLARGHVAALENSKPGMSIYNLGTGQGYSVLELIKSFEEVNGIKVPYKIGPRRAGDLATCYADISKAKKELGWQAEYDVKDMVRDSWNFENSK